MYDILFVFVFFEVCLTSVVIINSAEINTQHLKLCNILEAKGWSSIKNMDFNDGKNRISIKALLEESIPTHGNKNLQDDLKTKMHNGLIVLSSIYAILMKKIIHLQLNIAKHCDTLSNDKSKFHCLEKFIQSIISFDPIISCMLNALQHFNKNRVLKYYEKKENMILTIFQKLKKISSSEKITINRFKNNKGITNYNLIAQYNKKLKNSMEIINNTLTIYIEDHVITLKEEPYIVDYVKSLVKMDSNTKSINPFKTKIDEEIQRGINLFCDDFGFLQCGIN